MSVEMITALCVGAGGILSGLLTGLIAWRKSKRADDRSDFSVVVAVLQQQVAGLQSDVKFLHTENVALRVAIAASSAANDVCHAENTKLKLRVSELESEVAVLKGKAA